ncbi:MAG: hypothetical protein ACRDH6_02370 [Actinomycetota bacterium]
MVLLAAFLAKVVDLIGQATGGWLPRWATNLIALAAGIGTVEALQWSLFEQWRLPIVVGWVGTVFTGLIVYGLAAGIHSTYEVLSAAAKRTRGEVVPFDRQPRAAA